MSSLYHTEDVVYRSHELTFEICGQAQISIVLSTGILAKWRVWERIDKPFSWDRV